MPSMIFSVSLTVRDLTGGAVVAVESKFSRATVKMGFAAMLIDAGHPTLEH